jgi:hypothetical protein
MDKLRGGLSAVVAGLIGAFILSACTPNSGYVSSSSQGMFFKIPHSWRTYSQTSIKRNGMVTSTLPYLVAFDADPKPDLVHVLGSSTYPWGLAEVASISGTDRLNFSLDSLLNTIVPVDQLQSGSGNSVSDLSPSRVITRGTLRGVQVALRVSLNGKPPLSYEQISLVNNATTKTWVLLLGCSAACFNQHHGEINRVVSTWIVKSRQA